MRTDVCGFYTQQWVMRTKICVFFTQPCSRAELQTIHWCRLGQPAHPTMQGASICSIAAARSANRGSESVTVRSEEH
jgi:hypothetical protein